MMETNTLWIIDKNGKLLIFDNGKEAVQKFQEDHTNAEFFKLYKTEDKFQLEVVGLTEVLNLLNG